MNHDVHTPPHYPQAFEHAPYYAALFDLKGATLALNAKARTFNELSSEQARGLLAWELPSSKATDDIKAQLERAAQGETVRFRGSAHTDTRDEIILDITLTPLRNANGQLEQILACAHDISACVRSEQTLRRADARKTRFLSRLSHELRTPLHALLGFATLIKSDLPEGEARDSYAHLFAAGQHLRELIEDVADIARIERGELSLSSSALELPPTLHECTGMLRAKAEAKGIQLQLELPNPPLPPVRADRQRLKQILLNLLDNAIKFSPPGTTVCLSAAPYGHHHVRVSVHDRGPGIPSNACERIFEPFERLDAAQAGIDGSGLGLTLARRLAEQMDGHLSAESTLGVGSRFHLDLPRAQPSDAPKPAPIRLLYIEDRPDSARLMERLIQRHTELQLQLASSGQQGLELAQLEPPSLIILDPGLPDLSGEAVLQRLRANPSSQRTPILILSADANPEQRDALLAAGANRYLTKPIDPDTLLNTIQAYLPQTTEEEHE